MDGDPGGGYLAGECGAGGDVVCAFAEGEHGAVWRVFAGEGGARPLEGFGAFRLEADALHCCGQVGVQEVNGAWCG